MEVKEHLQAKSNGDLEVVVVVKLMRVSCILADRLEDRKHVRRKSQGFKKQTVYAKVRY